MVWRMRQALRCAMARAMGHLMWLIRWLYSFSSSVSFRPGWVLVGVWSPRWPLEALIENVELIVS